jgi:D-alanyl-lipoteichoic acid acyltransferase DltB (MBOAT superfamily)
LVLAHSLKLKEAFPLKDPAQAPPPARTGQHMAIAHELRPLLTLASIQRMETAIHAKLTEDTESGEIPYGLVLDTFDSLAYLSTWRAGLLEARVSEMAALLQWDNSAASA